MLSQAALEWRHERSTWNAMALVRVQENSDAVPVNSAGRIVDPVGFRAG
jgi:hypothetical protein